MGVGGNAMMTTNLHISNTDIETDGRIRKELVALAQLEDVEVRVIGIPDSNQGGNVTLDSVRYRKLRMAMRLLGALPRPLRYFFELIEFTIKAVGAGRRMNPDIVHCHDTFALPAGWILKRALGCRLVYDAHELESRKNAQNAILSCATLRIEKACWRQVDLLVSVSESIIEWYKQNLGPKPSVLVLNSPAIAEEPNAKFGDRDRRNYFHEKYGIPPNHLVFVYLGILGPGRGIEMCLDAFAAGPQDAHVVFIGNGRLETAIAAYAMRHPNVHIHHAVPHDHVVPLVRSADYGLCMVENVSLSDYLCLPNKLFEYAFARVRVLASDFPEIKRVVEEYSLGVCCAPNADRVRAELARLAGRRPDRPTLDISALSWDAQAARLRAAYRRELLAAEGVPVSDGASISPRY